jgi:aminopeptidase 2
MSYLVRYAMDFLSTKKDLEESEKYFEDKDTSKYNQSLQQTLDTIRAKIAYIERSTEDLGGWLGRWERRQ